MNYIKIWNTANKYTYNYLKFKNSNFNNYNITEFLDYIISFKNIKISSIHFTKSNISGMTISNSKGTSIHYEKENSESRQNFTKCHELGHILLKHKGNIFLETKNNKNQFEYEADIFSASLLMPDIILINLIYYQNKHFQDIYKELNISPESLKIRLIKWIEYYSDAPKFYIEKICLEFITRTNEKNIKLEIEKFKYYIENQYSNHKIDPIQQFSYYISKTDFITNHQLPNLSDIKLQNDIKQKFPNIKFWAYHNKGLTVWYAWNSKSLSDKQAMSKAKITSLLMTI